jgi:hypothetical protein
VFAELATSSVFARLAATPPHFTAPLGLMYTAGPVEILLFLIIVAAIFALTHS